MILLLLFLRHINHLQTSLSRIFPSCPPLVKGWEPTSTATFHGPQACSYQLFNLNSRLSSHSCWCFLPFLHRTNILTLCLVLLLNFENEWVFVCLLVLFWSDVSDLTQQWQFSFLSRGWSPHIAHFDSSVSLRESWQDFRVFCCCSFYITGFLHYLFITASPSEKESQECQHSGAGDIKWYGS